MKTANYFYIFMISVGNGCNLNTIQDGTTDTCSNIGVSLMTEDTSYWLDDVLKYSALVTGSVGLAILEEVFGVIGGEQADYNSYLTGQVNKQFDNLITCMDTKINKALVQLELSEWIGNANVFHDAMQNVGSIRRDKLINTDSALVQSFGFWQEIEWQHTSKVYSDYLNYLPVYETAMDIVILAYTTILEYQYRDYLAHPTNEICVAYKNELAKSQQYANVFLAWINDGLSKIESRYRGPSTASSYTRTETAYEYKDVNTWEIEGSRFAGQSRYVTEVNWQDANGDIIVGDYQYWTKDMTSGGYTQISFAITNHETKCSLHNIACQNVKQHRSCYAWPECNCCYFVYPSSSCDGAIIYQVRTVRSSIDTEIDQWKSKFTQKYIAPVQKFLTVLQNADQPTC